MKFANTRSLASTFGPVLLGALVLVGCAPPSAEETLRSARQEVQAGRYPAAIILLKQSVQNNPNSGETRFLLGSALLSKGDLVAAEVELRKARSLNYDASLVVPLLATALLDQGQPKKLLSEFADVKLANPAAALALDMSIASAHAKQGDRDASRSAVERLLNKDPQHVGARLLKARLMTGTAEAAAAKPLVDTVLSSNPKNAEAWQVLGDLNLFGGADLPAAVAAFRRVVEIRPASPLAHAAIVTTLLYLRDIEGANRQLQAMQKVLDGHPETRFLEASMAFAGGDFKSARDISQRLLKVYPTNAKILQFAGAVEVKMGSNQLAETYLNRALQASPDYALARQLLAQVYLRSGQPEKAMTVLRPLLQAPSPDGPTLMLVGESYLQDGDLKRAEEFFRKAAVAAPNDLQVRMSLALNELTKGNSGAGLTQLESIAATDTGTAANMALISAHLRLGQFDAALAAVDNLAKKDPERPVADGLAGRVLLDQGKTEAARKRFELALVKDPFYFPAVASLAALDIADKKSDLARQRFESVVKADPRNIPARLALVDLQIRAGMPKADIILALAEAVRTDPGNSVPRLYLINYLRSQHDMKATLVAAQEANSALPDRPEILDALGAALAINGEPNQALNVYRRLAVLQPKSGVPYMRIADAQQLVGDTKAAVQSLRRAVELEPGLVMAQKNLIALLRRLNQRPQAYEIAKGIQAQRPNEATGFVFEGDIAVEAKDWPRAAAAYRAGLGKAGISTASRLYVALQHGRKNAEAESFARDWLKSNPSDTSLIFQLGTTALTANNLPVAEAYFLEVVKQAPGNALAMNNAAWAMARQHKPGAVALAERALAIQPDTASFLDTLAFALADEGQFEKAIEKQRQAASLLPGNPSFAFNLAKLLMKSGDKEGAKVELAKLAGLGLTAPVLEEVKRLRQSL